MNLGLAVYTTTVAIRTYRILLGDLERKLDKKLFCEEVATNTAPWVCGLNELVNRCDPCTFNPSLGLSS